MVGIDIRNRLALLSRHDIEHEAVIREAVDYIDTLRKERQQFVERACAAIRKAAQYWTDQYDGELQDIERALRDEFK